MSIDLHPTLKNQLIILRPLSENDLEALYDVAKDPLIWEQHPCYDRYKRDVFAAFFQESIDSKGALIIEDKENNEVIGSSRFKLLDGVESAVEIGWTFLSRKCWGGKYNKSVKTLMIEHAFEATEDVIFYIGKDNIRSQKAVEKIGAIRISAAEYPLLTKGHEEDYTYRINKSTWQKS